MRNFARKLNFKYKIKLLYQITCYKMLKTNIYPYRIFDI
jgi:hypothetical protein